MNTTLLIMAAGIGSCFGKRNKKVGPGLDAGPYYHGLFDS